MIVPVVEQISCDVENVENSAGSSAGGTPRLFNKLDRTGTLMVLRWLEHNNVSPTNRLSKAETAIPYNAPCLVESKHQKSTKLSPYISAPKLQQDSKYISLLATTDVI